MKFAYVRLVAKIFLSSDKKFVLKTMMIVSKQDHHLTRLQCSANLLGIAIKPGVSTNVVCVKTQQKDARIKHHDRTKQ